MLVLLVTKLGIYINLGNYSGNLLRKCTLWKQADFTKCSNICGQLGAEARYSHQKMRHDKFRQILGHLSF